MAKRHFDSRLRKFLGNEKTDDLMNKMASLYFDKSFWAGENNDDSEDKLIKAYVCKNKTYQVKLAGFNSNKWKYTPNGCIALYMSFPFKSMNQKQIIGYFESQWESTVHNVKIRHWLGEL